MREVLTKIQALKIGYTHCYKEASPEYAILIEDCKFDGRYCLLEKELKPYQISEDLIYQLLCDHFESQDEVYIEDNTLEKLISEVDYTEVTISTNIALLGQKFYKPTDIILIP